MVGVDPVAAEAEAEPRSCIPSLGLKAGSEQ